jgi:hypothetical protein
MTTIKVRDADKRKFDRLQYEYMALHGEKINQQELFSRILEYVELSKEDFFKVKISNLNEEEIKKFRELQKDWGVETKEDEIDSMLYERPH